MSDRVGDPVPRPTPPQFDTNGDGCISLGELRAALKALLGERLSQREVDEILQDTDLNGDGLIDFEGTATLGATRPGRFLTDKEMAKGALSRCARPCAEHIYVVSHLIITRTQEKGTVIIPISRKRQSVFRKVSMLSKRSGRN